MLGPERPDLSPEHIAWIASRIPIERVQELGLHKHPHVKTMTQAALDDDPVGPLQVDTESCQVELWLGIDEKTKEVQKFALARLPCGRWLYWEGRECAGVV